MHVGGRIEASTVGRRASIFRDFMLPSGDAPARRRRRRTRAQLMSLPDSAPGAASGWHTGAPRSSRNEWRQTCTAMMPDPAVRTYTDLTTIIDAATGEGGRQPGSHGPSRYVTPIANTPLICHVLDELKGSGVERARIVAGAAVRAELERTLDPRLVSGVEITYVTAPDSDSLPRRPQRDRASTLCGSCARLSRRLLVPGTDRLCAIDSPPATSISSSLASGDEDTRDRPGPRHAGTSGLRYGCDSWLRHPARAWRTALDPGSMGRA